MIYLLMSKGWFPSNWIEPYKQDHSVPEIELKEKDDTPTALNADGDDKVPDECIR